MIRKFVMLIMCILIVFISACSGNTFLVKYVADTTLEIRLGKLYVTPCNGETYKTAIEADDITVVKPEFGTGTVVTAYVYKDHKIVATFSRSYVDDHQITRDEIEQEFGPVTKIPEIFSPISIIILFAVICAIVFTAKNILGKRKKRKKAGNQ